MAPPLSQPTSEDPDALCGAAIRVFLRKGWHPTNTCDSEARTVESSTVLYKDLGWSDGGNGTRTGSSVRVIVSTGRIEIGVSCMPLDDNGKPAAAIGCPLQSQELKNALAQEIIQESHSVAGAKRVRDQPPAPAPAPPAGGCTKDTDCKGDRVCQRGECVDPTPTPTPAPPAN